MFSSRDPPFDAKTGQFQQTLLLTFVLYGLSGLNLLASVVFAVFGWALFKDVSVNLGLTSHATLAGSAASQAQIPPADTRIPLLSHAPLPAPTPAPQQKTNVSVNINTQASLLSDADAVDDVSPSLLLIAARPDRIHSLQQAPRSVAIKVRLLSLLFLSLLRLLTWRSQILAITCAVMLCFLIRVLIIVLAVVCRFVFLYPRLQRSTVRPVCAEHTMVAQRFDLLPAVLFRSRSHSDIDPADRLLLRARARSSD